MKLIYIVIIVLFVTGASELKAMEWTKENTQWESAYMVTHIIDWGQTLEIAENPNFTEVNPILGSNPNRGDVNRYFLLTGIGHYLMSSYLDEWRETWQKTTFFIQFSVVANNAMLGVKITF